MHSAITYLPINCYTSKKYTKHIQDIVIAVWRKTPNAGDDDGAKLLQKPSPKRLTLVLMGF